MSILNFDKNNFSFNKVNNIIFFILLPLIQTNEQSIPKFILGKKRKLEKNRPSSCKKNSDSINFSSSNLNNKKSFVAPKITKDLYNFYNMERSICMSCVKTKNKKYQTNSFIPCLPFPNSS